MSLRLNEQMLLDTMVVSEMRKYPTHPHLVDQGVLDFFHANRGAEFYISAVTFGEFYKGHFKLLQKGATNKAAVLLTWIYELRQRFAGRILPFGQHEAELWGEYLAHDPQHESDKQIAATAGTHGMMLVTRNTKHMPKPPLVSTAMILNPFSGVLHVPAVSPTNPPSV